MNVRKPDTLALTFQQCFPGYRGLQYIQNFFFFPVISLFFTCKKSKFSCPGLKMNSHANFTYSFPQLNIILIDRNCDMLPLSLEHLLNYTTLMIKFCTNKLIWASLLRQVFLGGGKGPFHPQKRCNAPSAGYGFPRKKILCKLNTYCKLL